MFHLEIGNGWKLAVLDSEEEYEFLRQGQRSFINNAPYWIDGSANATLNEVFSYVDYIANKAGICEYEICLWEKTNPLLTIECFIKSKIKK